jgi:hypothetical protein
MILSVVLYLTTFIAGVSILWAESRWRSFLPAMIVDWILLAISASFVVPVAVLFGLHCYLSWIGVTTYDFIMDKRIKESRERNAIEKSQNVTENGPFSRSNKVGIEVDEVIFQPPVDLQTIVYQGTS